MTASNKFCIAIPLFLLMLIAPLNTDAQPVDDLSPSLAKAIAAQVQLDVNDLDIDTLAAIDVLALNGLSAINYEGIELLTNLKTLDVRGNTMSDLSWISRLTQLTKLDLHDNRISDLSPLSKLTALTTLDISNNLVDDLQPLSALKELQTLRASDNAIKNLAPLASLTGIVELDLASNRIQSISPLSQLKKINRLNLNKNSIADISPLRQLDRMTNLTINDNRINQLDPVSNLVSLKILHAQDNPIQSLQPLGALASLEFLSLQSSSFKGDLSPLKSLHKLNHLEVPHCDILSILALENITTLRRIDLSYNRIVDIAHLMPIAKTLEYVNLAGNPLSVESRGNHLRALRDKVHYDGEVLTSPRALSNSFAKFDLDNNDALSYSEAKKADPSLSLADFDALDTNKDWKITRNEIFYLVRPLPDSLEVAWLGKSLPGKGMGTKNNPFRSFAEAQRALKPGGRLILLPGVELHSTLLTEPMEIVSAAPPSPKEKPTLKTPSKAKSKPKTP